MSEEVYYLDVLVKNRLEKRTYIPTRSGIFLQEFRDVPDTRGGVPTGFHIPNPFKKEEPPVDTKDIVIILYLILFLLNLIFLICCLLYLSESQSRQDNVLEFFYYVGIILSIIDLFTLGLPEFIATMFYKILFFIYTSLNFTCSVLIIYFSKINLDALKHTKITKIICAIFIGIFAIFSFFRIFLEKNIEKEPEPQDPKVEAIVKGLREKYPNSIPISSIIVNRISEV
jgi:flagellar basal body-associated protein FliL